MVCICYVVFCDDFKFFFLFLFLSFFSPFLLGFGRLLSNNPSYCIIFVHSFIFFFFFPTIILLAFLSISSKLSMTTPYEHNLSVWLLCSDAPALLEWLKIICVEYQDILTCRDYEEAYWITSCVSGARARHYLHYASTLVGLGRRVYRNCGQNVPCTSSI